MAFDTLSDRLRDVANHSLAFCKGRYGNNGVKIEQGIDDTIMWRPSFYLKVGKFKIVAVEVEDNLYPESLKGAAHEISHFDFPISVYQACTLEAFLGDPKHKKVAQLKNHGFGIITVDDEGKAVIQHPCVPLAQHISPDAFDRAISGLSGPLKVAFRSAYTVYQTNETQGLQDAGQIVEAVIRAIGTKAVKAGDLGAAPPNQALANRIDDMYGAQALAGHRAALGGAREFVAEFRNTVSHPANTAKLAAEKIRKCRKGFLDAIDLAVKLRSLAQAKGYKIQVHIG
ncbi:hypothetical protein [Sphingomonas sp.]|uniref:hypothetical protein n=1 Tax=Sphingomonas sp. TaxID=28214 RepID=UPI001B2D0C98|nr:hypothetical protein [Sphingomonas sp.]MBO9714253.1 hypothetical protein [Sphingomonas sp.]